MDDYLIKARFEEAVKKAEYSARFLGFLEPPEYFYIQNLARQYKNVYVKLWGGHEEAQRLYVSVSSYEVSNEEFPFTAVQIEFREEDKLTHRDFLGSFMACGIKRETIGDILAEDSRAVVFVRDEILGYFLNSFSKIGNVGVRLSLDVDQPLPVAYRFTQVKGVIASNRVDCVVAFLMKNSREKASNAIKAQLVKLNYSLVSSVSLKIKDGDKISIRGIGKFKIEQLGPLTKKERLQISCLKYI